MSISARTAALLLVLSACDMIHQNPPPRISESRHNASGDRGGLLACYDDCRRQELEPTDAVTCRNNCEMAFKITPTAVDPAVDAAAECMHKCGDSRPCVQGCKRRAQRADKTVTADALRRLAACVDACQADRTLDDGNRWTCVRNCAPAARLPDRPTS